MNKEMEGAVASSNEFNLNLLRTYRNSKQQGNIFYSSTSISIALSMLYKAAKENTKKELETVLSIKSDSSIHEGFQLIFKSFQTLTGDTVLNIVNLLAVDKNYNILPEFCDNLKSNYNSDIKQFDFVRCSDGARSDLNHFIEVATSQKIKDLFPPDAIDSLTRLVLANAIYFKGMWSIPFDKKNTKKSTFYTSTNDEIVVDMMYRIGDYRYAHSYDLNAGFLEIPYLGDRLRMVIILPTEKDGLPFVENNISVNMLNKVIEKMYMNDDVHLSLPKFTLKDSVPLQQCLKSMGMKEAFTSSADFSGVSGNRDLCISSVLHQAFIEVNEEGTEAAAATFIVLMNCCYMPPIHFTVDHPFMFLIQEISTGLILFTGSVHSL